MSVIRSSVTEGSAAKPLGPRPGTPLRRPVGCVDGITTPDATVVVVKTVGADDTVVVGAALLSSPHAAATSTTTTAIATVLCIRSMNLRRFGCPDWFPENSRAVSGHGDVITSSTVTADPPRRDAAMQLSQQRRPAASRSVSTLGAAACAHSTTAGGTSGEVFQPNQ